MNAIDRERLLKWLKSLDSTYVTKEIIPQIESGAFDIKQPEVPDLYVDLLDKLIEGLQKLYLIMKTDHDEAHEAEAYDVCDLLEEPLEIVQNILHEIGANVE